MYVPGNDERKLAKIPSLNVDCVVLDMEDGVAINKKDEARSTIRNVLETKRINFGRSECTVRVNSVESELCEDDLEAILTSPNLPNSIHLPKVDFVDHLNWFSDTSTAILKRVKSKTRMNLIIFIESAQALLALPEICKAAWQLSVSTHFIPDALVFGSDDYCADIGATRTKDAKELLYARQYLVTCAKAFKLQAIDIVHIDYKDSDGLKLQCREGADMGFTGKQVIHPGQIEICQNEFAPSPSKIEWARELLLRFEEQQESGKGAFEFRGSMIDMPLVLQAKNVVQLASIIESK